MRAILLVNPNSRSATATDLDAGLASLREAGLEVEVIESDSAAESRRAIVERRAQLDLVIIAGGDGTISSCAGVLRECDLPLAILPLGTANDLARSLGIDDLRQAFAAIRARHFQPIDLGTVNGHYFFNVANLGLGVKVTQELTPEVKERWGVFSYLKALCAALARSDQFRVKLAIDGKRYAMRSIQLAVGNGRFYGGGNVVDDAARINDATLFLYSLRPQRVWELLTLAPLLRGGRHHLAERVFNATGKRIEIETSPTAMEIHADGEPVTQTPATFTVLPAALKVIVPEGSELLAGEKGSGS